MNNKTNIKPCAYCQDLEDRHIFYEHNSCDNGYIVEYHEMHFFPQMRQTTSFGGLNNIIALPIPLAILKNRRTENGQNENRYNRSRRCRA